VSVKTDARKEMLERADSSLSIYVRDWARIIYDATGDQTKVDRAIFLADLNGMFDPVKVAALASSSPVKPDCAEIERETIERCARWHEQEAAVHAKFRDELNRHSDDHEERTAWRSRKDKEDFHGFCAASLRTLPVTGEAREADSK
jgi:Zn-dependent M32 family carboxypeptidase